jgi:uncharacterized membrane protein
METTQHKAAQAKTALAFTFSLAVLLNLVDAFWDPDGQAWFILRVTVSVLFGVALVAYIAMWLRQRRSRTAR